MLISILAAVCIAAPWWLPGTSVCAALGWASAAAIVLLAKQKKNPYRKAYIAGVLIHPLAFYWLWTTIAKFGGFSLFPTFLIFSLFALLSPLQFLLFIFIQRHLPKWTCSLCISTACAWLVSEVISIRIFPWNLGHTQIAFLPIAQLAEIGGSLLVGFTMLTLAELALSRKDQNINRKRLALTSLIILSIGYGLVRTSQIDSILQDPSTPMLPVVLTQGNISLHDKHNPKLFRKNLEKYISLSKPHLSEGSLVVWPETVVMEWIYAGVGNVSYDKRLPKLGEGVTLLLGAPTFEDKEHMYNSGVAILPNGKVLTPYHKQILMPFGEYTPFGDWFPWIKDINASAGDFSRGDGPQLLSLPREKNQDIRVAALICYEDIVPFLSSVATTAGAEILVNLTNDAWFGKTIAPKQHHIIAAFRAIENRRYLLRATNTGLTAIVDPVGRTTSQLPLYTEGVISKKVALLRTPSFYSSYIPANTGLALSLLLLLISLLNINRVKT